MRTSTLLLGLTLCLAPLAASAQTVPPPAIAQVEARLQELERAHAQQVQRQGQLAAERARTAQALAELRPGSSQLLVAERARLQRSLGSLDRQQAQLASRREEIERSLRDEQLAALALYEHALARTPDPALAGRRDALRARLGLDRAAREPAQIKAQVEQAEQAEAKLRRKAAVVASKIRALVKQQQLAGSVARTLRDQALFDEEERRLEQSRVAARSEVTQSASSGDGQGSTNRGGAECSGAACGEPVDVGTPGSGGNTPPPADGDDMAGVFDPSAGESYAGDASNAISAAGQSRGSSALLSDLVAGSRVTTLLDEDVETLLGRGRLKAGGGADDELRGLEALRIELLRSADRLASEREQLEQRARSGR